jgi:hypothetical protein
MPGPFFQNAQAYLAMSVSYTGKMLMKLTPGGTIILKNM